MKYSCSQFLIVPNTGINIQAVGETSSELAALIRRLDSLDEPPASSSPHRWSLWGGESPPEETSPSRNATTTTRDLRRPSFSGSTLSSSPTLLNGKPRPWSLARWIRSRSLVLKSELGAPSETGGISPPLPSWSLFRWWKNRLPHHQAAAPARTANPDVGSLPV